MTDISTPVQALQTVINLCVLQTYLPLTNILFTAVPGDSLQPSGPACELEHQAAS